MGADLFLCMFSATTLQCLSCRKLKNEIRSTSKIQIVTSPQSFRKATKKQERKMNTTALTWIICGAVVTTFIFCFLLGYFTARCRGGRRSCEEEGVDIPPVVGLIRLLISCWRLSDDIVAPSRSNEPRVRSSADFHPSSCPQQHHKARPRARNEYLVTKQKLEQ